MATQSAVTDSVWNDSDMELCPRRVHRSYGTRRVDYRALFLINRPDRARLDSSRRLTTPLDCIVGIMQSERTTALLQNDPVDRSRPTKERGWKANGPVSVLTGDLSTIYIEQRIIHVRLCFGRSEILRNAIYLRIYALHRTSTVRHNYFRQGTHVLAGIFDCLFVKNFT